MIIHYYAGSCADLFDAEGVSLGVLPYANEDEFAQAAENGRLFPRKRSVSTAASQIQCYIC